MKKLEKPSLEGIDNIEDLLQTKEFKVAFSKVLKEHFQENDNENKNEEVKKYRKILKKKLKWHFVDENDQNDFISLLNNYSFKEKAHKYINTEITCLNYDKLKIFFSDSYSDSQSKVFSHLESEFNEKVIKVIGTKKASKVEKNYRDYKESKLIKDWVEYEKLSLEVDWVVKYCYIEKGNTQELNIDSFNLTEEDLEKYENAFSLHKIQKPNKTIIKWSDIEKYLNNTDYNKNKIYKIENIIEKSVVILLEYNQDLIWDIILPEGTSITFITPSWVNNTNIDVGFGNSIGVKSKTFWTKWNVTIRNASKSYNKNALLDSTNSATWESRNSNIWRNAQNLNTTWKAKNTTIWWFAENYNIEWDATNLNVVWSAINYIIKWDATNKNIWWYAKNYNVSWNASNIGSQSGSENDNVTWNSSNIDSNWVGINTDIRWDVSNVNTYWYSNSHVGWNVLTGTNRWYFHLNNKIWWDVVDSSEFTADAINKGVKWKVIINWKNQKGLLQYVADFLKIEIK